MTGFWSSETMRSRFANELLVTPFDPRHIKNCAYELTMGPQALITGEDDIRKDLDNGEQIKIPPGHFAQLLTEEVVRIPSDALGLISMKSKVKSLGLVNVSGSTSTPDSMDGSASPYTTRGRLPWSSHVAPLPS